MGYGLALILTTFWTVSSWGTIIITGVDGASGFYPGNYGLQGTVVNTNTTTQTSVNPIVYGGAAGITSQSCTSPSVQNPDGTCNTCAGTPTRTACNFKAVYGNLPITFRFRSTSITGPGRPIIQDPTSGGGTLMSSALQNVTGPNQEGSITVLWSALCIAAGSDGNCSTTSSATLSMGFDKFDGVLTDSVSIQVAVSTPAPTVDDEIDYCGPPTLTAVTSSGVCSFRVFPGDEKVYLINLLPGTTFPTVNSSGSGSTVIQINSLMLFYATDGFNNILPSAPSKAFQIALNPGTTNSNTFDVTPNKASGFENQVDYFFRLASVDQASNVAFFTKDQAITDACGASALSWDGSSPLSDSDLQNCPFVARPDKVSGLLTKDLNCFIASAAYGSVLDSRLKIFRAFRGSILLSSKWGRELNQFYYTYGPYGARFLNSNPWLKPTVRLFLWPALLFAKLSLDIGAPGASLVMLFIFSAFVFSCFQLKVRKPRAEPI